MIGMGLGRHSQGELPRRNSPTLMVEDKRVDDTETYETLVEIHPD